MLSAALAPLISDCLLHQIDEDFLAAYQASYGVAQPETTPTDHTQITATMETRSESITTALKEAKNSDKKVHITDTVSKGSTVFRNPRALGCSVPSAARALRRARGFLNTVDPIGHSI